MPQKTNPKINFDSVNETDLAGQWFEQDKEFKQTRQENYREYRQVFRKAFSSNTLNQFLMTYTQFVNFITKNAVVATIIMVLAVGGTTTVAAEFFAPQEYKPSTLLGLNKISSYEDCEKANGKIIQKEGASSCEINGQAFIKIGQACLDEKCENPISLRQCSFQNEDGRGFVMLVPDSFNCQVVYPEYKPATPYLQISNGKIRFSFDYIARLGCTNEEPSSTFSSNEKCGDFVLHEDANYKVFSNDYYAYAVVGGKNNDQKYPAVSVEIIDASGQVATSGSTKLSTLGDAEKEMISIIIGAIQPQSAETLPSPENNKLLTFTKSNFTFQYSNTYKIIDPDDSNAPEYYDHVKIVNVQDEEKTIDVRITRENPLAFMNQMTSTPGGMNANISADTQITNQYGVTGRKLTHKFNYADAGWTPEFTTTEIVFQKDNLYYNISTKEGKLCWYRDNTCEHSKSDEKQIDLIFNTFRFSDTKQSYTNPFYPDLAINYDTSWKFSTETRETSVPRLLSRTVTLEKNGTILTFEFQPFEVNGPWGCLNVEDTSAKVNVQGDLNRFKDTRLKPGEWAYLNSEEFHSCPFSVLKTANLEKYKTQNGTMIGVLRVFLKEGANADTIKEADQIVVNSKFPSNGLSN